MRERRLSVLALRYLWLGVLVFASAMLCLLLGKMSENLSCIWISNGFYIGFVLCINPRHRNELLPIAVVANYVAYRLSGIDPGWSAGLTASSMTQILMATYPMRRQPVLATNLTQIGSLAKLGLYAIVLGCVAQGLALLMWSRVLLKAHFSPLLALSMFCSYAVGTAVAIPLCWYAKRKPALRGPQPFKYEVQLSFLVFCAVAAGVFWETTYPFLFLLFPLLIPVVHAGGFVGAARAVLVTTVIGVVATAYGHGPLMLVHQGHDRIMVLQFFIAVVLLTALPFAALVMEREQLLHKLQTSETRYRELSRLDGLTQLANRREFDAFLEVSRIRATRQGTPLSLLLIDIDHFKRLNDEFGHTTGDEYLRKLAVAISEAVPRKTDLVARYGGEEFGVVLDSCDEVGALLVAERVQERVASLSLRLVSHHMPPLGVSIGVATTVPDFLTPSKALIDAADQGLYAAKCNGRNRIERGTDLKLLPR